MRGERSVKSRGGERGAGEERRGEKGRKEGCPHGTVVYDACCVIIMS